MDQSTENLREETLIKFIKELNKREKNFAESLKRSNDRLEDLLIAESPKAVGLNPAINKNDSIKSSLKHLAKEFEEVVNKAQERGLFQLVEPIKETVTTLRQLGTILDIDEQENDETITCNCNEWGGDRLNERGQLVCEKCEENCTCPEDNWPRVPDPRKRDHKLRRNVEKVQMSDSKPKSTITDKRDEEANGKDPEVTRSCILDLSAIKISFIDKSHDRKIVRDRCPLEDASNVKDEMRRCVYSVKENGKTDSPKSKLKEHMPQDEEAMSKSNVEEFQPHGRERRKIVQMSSSEYSERHKSFRDIEDEFYETDQKIEEKNICSCICEDIEKEREEQVCPCGCAEVVELKVDEAIRGDDCDIEDGFYESDQEIENKNIFSCSCEDIEQEREEQVCSCGCAKVVELKVNEAIKGDDCEYTEPCNLCACELSSTKSSGNSSGMEEKTITTYRTQLLNELAEMKDQRGEEDIGKPATKLEEEIHSSIKKSSSPKANKEIRPRKIHRIPKPINFRVVREICSCLLIAWNMPENIPDISGYEIRINRNIVAARVRCPTRTEVVIGPLDLSGPTTDLPGLMILTLYAVDSNGEYSELSSIKIQICNSL